MSEEREKILNAALDEFAEVGIGRASLESIANRIPLDVGAVRALFVDKKNLLMQVLKEKAVPAISACGMVIEETENTRERFRKGLHVYDQWWLANPKIAMISIWCSLEGPAGLEALYEQDYLPSELFGWIKKAVEKRQVRCADPFILDLLIDSMIIYPHLARQSLAAMYPSQNFDELIERRFEAIMDLLEHGLFTDKQGD